MSTVKVTLCTTIFLHGYREAALWQMHCWHVPASVLAFLESEQEPLSGPNACNLVSVSKYQHQALDSAPER